MWQRLISISLSISQVMGKDAFSFSHCWATFVLILWYSGMQGLFHLCCYVCVRVCKRVCVHTSVQVRLFIRMYHTSQCSCCSLFHHKMEPLLSLTDRVRQAEWPRLARSFFIFFSRNYFFINSNHVIWLIMNLHSYTAYTFTFDICDSRPEFLTPSPPDWIQIFVIKRGHSFSLNFTLTSFNYSFTSFHVC